MSCRYKCIWGTKSNRTEFIGGSGKTPPLVGGVIHRKGAVNMYNYNGWKRQQPDHRDYLYGVEEQPEITTALPSTDLTARTPAAWDQGQVGSCTGHGAGFTSCWDLYKEGVLNFMPSRLMVYYDGRIPEGTTREDSGATIRDVIKGLAQYGVCHEALWPYVISKVTRKPTVKAYTEATKYKVTKYLAVNQTANDIELCLSNDYPVVFGMSVYESFESDVVAKTGVVPMPKKSEQLLGGHCMAIVGYDHAKQLFLVRNSWGTSWGLEDGNVHHQGHCLIPYAYLLNQNLASDFWTVRTEAHP